MSHNVFSRFRWVVCQLETLRRSVQRNVRGILSKLPKTLDETYERVLRDIHEDNKEHARRLLHCLAVAIRPLFVEELAEILAFDFDVPEGGIPEFHTDWRWKDHEEAVLSTCSSLITIAEYGHSSSRRVVQFSHFSVKEFLVSTRLASSTRDVSQYHILPEPAHTILAQACLGFLLHLDDHIDTQKVKDFPLAKYAAMYWVAHAQFEDVAVHVKCGMKDLFDPDKPHFASWIRIHNVDGPRFQEARHVTRVTRGTPLYYSALAGFYDLAKHLAIKHPLHVNAFGGVHQFPLLAALSRKHIRVAELLLEHGGKVDVQNSEGHTPLHILENSKSEFYMFNYHDDQVLFGSRFLLKHGADVNAKDNGHRTPLYLAMRHETPYLTRFLLENGADPRARDKAGETPLHKLLEKQSYHPRYHSASHILIVAQLLLERGADVNARDDDHKTPLLLAMEHKASKVVLFLLEHGADPMLQNRTGKTPFHMLLGRLGLEATKSKFDYRYRSADHVLVVARLLLERGTDVNARDNNHNTLLLLAMRHETSDLVHLLLKHGADTSLKNKAGETPLHILLEIQGSGWNRHCHLANHILVVAQLLLHHGADVNAQDNDHNTPLFLAMRHEASDVVLFLLEHGADPNLQNKEGKTPFHKLLGPQNTGWVPIYHSPDYICVVAQLLLEHGANVNSRDNGNNTPLLLARQLERGSSDLERLLLERGADPNLVAGQ
jgi:ankyrin repeat protein